MYVTILNIFEFYFYNSLVKKTHNFLAFTPFSLKAPLKLQFRFQTSISFLLLLQKTADHRRAHSPYIKELLKAPQLNLVDVIVHQVDEVYLMKWRHVRRK